MDEETTRRGPVGHHPLGANAQAGVRVILVGGHPPPGVAAPAELGKGFVKPFGQCREDDLEVEVAGAHAQKRPGAGTRQAQPR